MIPAGWIPPEFREFIYADMSPAEIQLIVGSLGYFDEAGRHDYSYDELVALGHTRKIIGVRDTRDGSEHFNQSDIMFKGGSQ